MQRFLVSLRTDEKVVRIIKSNFLNPLYLVFTFAPSIPSQSTSIPLTTSSFHVFMFITWSSIPHPQHKLTLHIHAAPCSSTVRPAPPSLTHSSRHSAAATIEHVIKDIVLPNGLTAVGIRGSSAITAIKALRMEARPSRSPKSPDGVVRDSNWVRMCG